MKYEKRTPKDFEQRLKAGDYESPTGARRAVGKMSSWKQAEKDKAYGMIDKHFGSSASAPVKTTKKVTKKAAKKVAKKAATKRAAPVEEAKAEPPKREPKLARRRKSAKRSATAASTSSEESTGEENLHLTKADDHELIRINIIGMRIGTAVQALQAMEKAKEHGVDTTSGAQHAQNVLTQSIAELDNTARTAATGTNGAHGKFAQTAAALGSSPVAAPPAPPESDPPPVS